MESKVTANNNTWLTPWLLSSESEWAHSEKTSAISQQEQLHFSSFVVCSAHKPLVCVHVCGFDCGGVSLQKYLMSSINKRRAEKPRAHTPSWVLCIRALSNTLNSDSSGPTGIEQSRFVRPRRDYRGEQARLQTTTFQTFLEHSGSVGLESNHYCV